MAGAGLGLQTVHRKPVTGLKVGAAERPHDNNRLAGPLGTRPRLRRRRRRHTASRAGRRRPAPHKNVGRAQDRQVEVRRDQRGLPLLFFRAVAVSNGQLFASPPALFAENEDAADAVARLVVPTGVEVWYALDARVAVEALLDEQRRTGGLHVALPRRQFQGADDDANDGAGRLVFAVTAHIVVGRDRGTDDRQTLIAGCFAGRSGDDLQQEKDPQQRRHDAASHGISLDFRRERTPRRSIECASELANPRLAERRNRPKARRD